MDLAIFQNRIKQHNLEHHIDDLLHALKNTIKLYPVATSEAAISIGTTKIGGKPDLPPSVFWPRETISQAIKPFHYKVGGQIVFLD